MREIRTLTELPLAFQAVCHEYVAGLRDVLGDKLYGVYLYGAAVFADGGPVQDVDCHVILADRLTEAERQQIAKLHSRLAAEHPPLGSELDAYFILYEMARLTQIPQHQLRSEIYDNAWSLHCAHIRAGRFETLYGPQPDGIFPLPSWQDVTAALDHELAFVKANLRYPAYCVLNLCRILYSFQTRDVVVSKRYAAAWAREEFPQWQGLIATAERHYDLAGAVSSAEVLAGAEVRAFLAFADDRIREIRAETP